MMIRVSETYFGYHGTFWWRFEALWAPSVVSKLPPTWYRVTEFDPQQFNSKRHS